MLHAAHPSTMRDAPVSLKGLAMLGRRSYSRSPTLPRAGCPYATRKVEVTELETRGLPNFHPNNAQKLD